ncbi:16S rRNA methyltransferase G [Chlorella sorokiniana]|uniref:16S rRNA methyltransferase G n=1 Tax=Chlorella sorokiniana TaxID=3076 RepID=A0A2P6TBH5_CHLSO|nr:16S rRNA methyltransferase G [Chlorella sorokiniana]|eukprot:PRW05902.1 16S rRNA methyltransferase G [Chlorella sorokiniana]
MLLVSSTDRIVGSGLAARPQLAAELHPLAAAAGVADAAALSRAVAALGPKPEQRVLEHGAAVAELLLGLGVPQSQLAQLLPRCPLLFSRPADERPALLFEQLAQLGLTAAEAARCFEKQPMAAGSVSFEPAIPVLAALLSAGLPAGSNSGEQLLGDLLREQPAAVILLGAQPSTLEQRISHLVQRYGPHWKQQNKQAVTAGTVRQTWAVLGLSPEHLLALEAVLQQELGQQPGDGTRLLATIVQHHCRAAACSPETLRRRARLLKAEFAREQLLQVAPNCLSHALAVGTAVWQRALAVWRLLGVADPAAVAHKNFLLISYSWLAPGVQAKLAAMQRLLPWGPTAAAAVQQHGSYVVGPAPKRLIGRLLFLQQEGLLLLLVADKAAAQRQWRKQHSLPAGRRAEGEPQLISLRDTAILSDTKFGAMLESVAAGQSEQPAGSGGSTAERYHTFMAQLLQLPAYQRLLAEGAAEAQRLAALLPPELLAEAAERGDEDEILIDAEI